VTGTEQLHGLGQVGAAAPGSAYGETSGQHPADECPPPLPEPVVRRRSHPRPVPGIESSQQRGGVSMRAVIGDDDATAAWQCPTDRDAAGSEQGNPPQCSPKPGSD